MCAVAVIRTANKAAVNGQLYVHQQAFSQAVTRFPGATDARHTGSSEPWVQKANREMG